MLVILDLLAAIAFLVLGILALKNDFKSIANRIFFVFCLFGVLLYSSHVILFVEVEYSLLITVDRLTLLFSSGLAASMTAFALVFAYKPTRYGWKLFLIYFPVLVIGVITVISPHFIRSVKIVQYNIIEDTGPAYIVWLLSVVICVLVGVGIFIDRYRKTDLYHIKRQVQIVSLGLVGGGVLALAGTSILPLFNVNEFYHVGIASGGVIGLIAMYYAIIARRLMDIRTVLSRTIFWLFMSAMLFIPFVTVVLLLEPHWSEWKTITHVFIYGLAFLLFYLYFNGMQRWLEKLFWRKRAKMDDEVAHFIDNLLLIRNIDDLAKKIQETISRTVNTEAALVYARGLTNYYNVLDDSDVLDLDEALRQYLVNGNDIVEYESFFIDPLLRGLSIGVVDILRKRKGQVLVPLVFRKEIMGLIIVANRKDNRTFNYDELNFFRHLKSPMSMALNNAILYRDLESIVETKTQELTRQNLALEYALQANERDMHIFRAIHEFSQLLLTVSYYSPRDFYRALASIFPGFIGIKAVAVFEYDKENKEFLFLIANDITLTKGKYPEVIRYSSKDFLSHVAATQKPAIIYDTANCTDYNKTTIKKLNSARSIIGVPLVRRGEVNAVLLLLDKTDEQTFDKYDYYFVNTIVHLLQLSMEKVKMFEERLNSERLAMVGQMTANIVHDVKNPIATIRGFAECLASPEFTKEDRFEFIGIVLDESERLLEMTSEILEFTRGKIEIVKSESDVNEFITSVQKYLYGMFRMKNIQIKKKLGFKGKVRFDSNKMKRVLYNVAHNAFDAMGESGVFELGVEQKDEWVIFSLKDNGPGIPEEIREQLFTPFETYGKEQGTGLGMAIAKSIVDAHGGRIYFDTVMDKGTTFFIEIPML